MREKTDMIIQNQAQDLKNAFSCLERQHSFIYLFVVARSLALGHWGISSSFRKFSTAGDYIPCSAYKDIEKAAEKVNSITSGDEGGDK